MKELSFKVAANQAGMRLDLYLVAVCEGFSRRRLRQIIDLGGVYVNKSRVRVASRALRAGDQVVVVYRDAKTPKKNLAVFSFTPETILYEDDKCLVINKPPGLPSQATRDQSVMHVLQWLEEHLPHSKKKSFTLVHRLDQETSGALLVAKHPQAATVLMDQFRHKEVEKTYIAISVGAVTQKNMVIKSYLSDISRHTGMVREVHAGGKPSETHVKILEVSGKVPLSLVECKPLTGRSHQIRVHLAGRGLPILGDKKYGKLVPELPAEVKELAGDHHFLHALHLTFTPAGQNKPVTVSAPYPPNFEKIFTKCFSLGKIPRA